MSHAWGEKSKRRWWEGQGQGMSCCSILVLLLLLALLDLVDVRIFSCLCVFGVPLFRAPNPEFRGHGSGHVWCGHVWWRAPILGRGLFRKVHLLEILEISEILASQERPQSVEKERIQQILENLESLRDSSDYLSEKDHYDYDPISVPQLGASQAMFIEKAFPSWSIIEWVFTWRHSMTLCDTQRHFATLPISGYAQSVINSS